MGTAIMLDRLAPLALRAIDPEVAHRLTVRALGLLPASAGRPVDPRLAMTLAGVHVAHPVGLAAGFDKDARAIHAIGHLGFAAGEVGTITPLAQSGNPRPRLFRLADDHAVINRMGFNNGGLAAAIDRLSRIRRGRHVPIGINIGANKDSASRIADYATGIAAMAPFADWLTVNISSPNTPGLRGLHAREELERLLDAVLAARDRATPRRPVVWVEFSTATSSLTSTVRFSMSSISVAIWKFIVSPA